MIHRVSFMPGMVLPDLVSFNYKCIVFVIAAYVNDTTISSAIFVDEMLVWMAWVLERFQVEFARYILNQLKTVVLAIHVGIKL